MKWPRSTLTDSRSRYYGKNERKGRAEPGQALRLINGSGSDQGNGATVGRRICLSVESGFKTVQTFSVSTSFRRGWRMVRADGGAGRPADMAKSSEWRTDFGHFWLRRGIGFAGLDGGKDCAMPGTETGESTSKAKGFPA
jgi:hypothetical protein